MMKERPILFSGPMVRAILEGRKTQTRRVCKVKDANGNPLSEYSAEAHDALIRHHCPYGKPGDRLWVRETHYRYGKWLKNGKAPTGRQKWRFKPLTDELHYFDDPPEDVKGSSYRKEAWYKRPSIFMPRWASRINLEIVSIRVERVQDISDVDAQAEGIFEHAGYYKLYMKNGIEGNTDSPILSFTTLWDSINAKRGYAWKDNPWVWVVEFKRA